MPVDVQGQPFNPGRVVNMNSGEQASINFVPISSVFPASSSGVTVVEVGKGGQPKLEDEEWHEVDLPQASIFGEFGPHKEEAKEGKKNGSDLSNNILFGDEGEDIVVHLVENGAFKEQWAIHVVCKGFFPARHFGKLFLGQRLPEVISVEIVCVGVVVIVGNFPAVVWEEEWRHADSSKEFVHQSVFGEGLMGAVVSNNKQSSGSSSKQDPSEGQEIPRSL